MLLVLEKHPSPDHAESGGENANRDKTDGKRVEGWLERHLGECRGMSERRWRGDGGREDERS